MTWIAHTSLGLALLTACAVSDATVADAEGTGSSGSNTAGGNDVTDAEGTGSSGSNTAGGNDVTGVGLDDDSSSTEDTMPDGGSESLGTDTTDDGCPVGTEGCLCDVGAVCDDDLACVEGECGGRLACTERDEGKHGTEDTATGLEADKACGGASTSVEGLGTIYGPEADWYVFTGNDGGILCNPNPNASVTSDEDLAVCVFLDCDIGDVTNVQCGVDIATNSVQGKPGCCGTNVAFVSSYECPAFPVAGVSVYISIESTDPVCADYDLSYGM